ncbi:DUF5994 family protein [Nocardia jiangxiensis]|uniref:DUF5994 family protein n=1 Tax=Nocardia jiangxiensis TaxID=282685 RepID=UPI0003042970|nr:DUF5994 family protein [Nocardia jiangxiensis]
MTQQPHVTNAGRQASPSRSLRLELDSAGVGDVDGAWWPHSRDLVAELTDLFSVLRPGLGPIRRVIYHLDEWSAAPRELDSPGRRVRLDGYRHRPARTLDVIGRDIGATLTLRIITPVADVDMTAAQQHWDSERGRGADAAAWLRARSAARRGRRAGSPRAGSPGHASR